MYTKAIEKKNKNLHSLKRPFCQIKSPITFLPPPSVRLFLEGLSVNDKSESRVCYGVFLARDTVREHQNICSFV